jgi:hypothetical protein
MGTARCRILRETGEHAGVEQRKGAQLVALRGGCVQSGKTRRLWLPGRKLTSSPPPMRYPLWGLQAEVVQGPHLAQPTASAAGPAPSTCRPPGCLRQLQLQLLRCRLHGLHPLGHIGGCSRGHGTSLGVCRAEVGPGSQAVMRWHLGHYSVL